MIVKYDVVKTDANLQTMPATYIDKLKETRAIRRDTSSLHYYHLLAYVKSIRAILTKENNCPIYEDGQFEAFAYKAWVKSLVKKLHNGINVIIEFWHLERADSKYTECINEVMKLLAEHNPTILEVGEPIKLNS